MPTPLALDGFQSSEIKLIKRRVENPIDCVYHPRFDDRTVEEQLLGPIPGGGLRPRDARASSDDSGVDLLAIPKTQALTSDQEQHLFLRLNLARYRIVELLKAFATKRLSASAANELLKWEKISLKTRSDIVRANVPLVLAMAKRTRISGVDLSDLISEGNLALLRAVDKFDCDRGFKFSTYACRAILKSFSRVATRTSRYRGYFPTDFDPTMEKSDFLERQRDAVERDSVEELKSILGGNQARLSDVEEKVIRARFALEQTVSDDAARGRTLEQVGEMIGVTKERVRQIQNKALKKLKSAMETKAFAPH
ncbi:MAG: sigma-70 family RNA polymerase sigma factor [Phycisphaerae bacterium]